MLANVGRFKVGTLFALALFSALVAGCECGSGGGSRECSLLHPEYCPDAESPICSPDWTLTITPGEGDVTQGTSLAITSNLDVTDAARAEARILYEMTLTDASDVSDTVAGRYLSPLILDRGGVTTVRARFYCDPTETFRTAVTLTVVPEGHLELTPAPGSYRTQVAVAVRVEPGDLQVFIDLVGDDIGTSRQTSRSVSIPPTGLSYGLRVTATDGYGHVVTQFEGSYVSDPFTPEVAAVSGMETVGDYEVFSIEYDREITGTFDPSGSNYFYHVRMSPYVVNLYPRFRLPSGPLVLRNVVQAFGEGGAHLQRDPLALLEMPRSVCACDAASLSVLFPERYSHFLMSPPTTVAVESSVALDPLSLVLTVESVGNLQTLQIVSTDIVEQNAEGTRFVLALDRANLVLGGYYNITVNASSLHPLDKPLEAAVPFSTELPGYIGPLEVTTASGIVVGNHALQADRVAGWAWFGNNPMLLAPVSDNAYLDATLTVQDAAGEATVVTVPAQYPNQDTNAAYRTLAVWPPNGTIYIQNWSELTLIATYSDRDRSSLMAVSAEVTFDDGRSYATLPIRRTGNSFKMFLPEGFYDYPATMAVLGVRLAFESSTQGPVEFDVAVTYIVESGQLSPHFVRDSWSWFSMTDTDTSSMDILSGGISVLYSGSVSSVTLEVSSPLPVTTLVFDTTGASRWTVAEGASLSPVTQGGVFSGTLRMRDTMGVLLDQMHVPLPVAPVRSFANALSATVDQSLQDSYVLQWNGGFDPLYVAALLFVQVFPSTTVNCAGPSEASILQMMWPADVPQAYIPVGDLSPGLYGVCASLFVADSYDGSGFAMQQTRLVIDVQ